MISWFRQSTPHRQSCRATQASKLEVGLGSRSQHTLPAGYDGDHSLQMRSCGVQQTLAAYAQLRPPLLRQRRCVYETDPTALFVGKADCCNAAALAVGTKAREPALTAAILFQQEASLCLHRI
ncbi:hypothetical protein BAUCODRAFT_335698 [Baudoinia panamericana UAMH 10762]|uniref:Uncharacterized protein n=1 Tax=Baudoinia panamericana (strain UAMH 10762) TaxID=717646 RepID=M2MX87_BAUPA|nr:uncharacterized protein BAUCODRAFT_335698 [Baudoinia panamericana UAMH 10762]EMC90865.1 hypothetical protein BAUCODRAFT_335698 [Baudoinia panamericana UAMH 10762]